MKRIYLKPLLIMELINSTDIICTSPVTETIIYDTDNTKDWKWGGEM